MLNESQISGLYEIFLKEISEKHFSSPLANEPETAFTARVLFPWLRDWVAALRKPGLYVRGDGGPTIAPVVWHGISFRPDLGIYSGDKKYLSIEVKLLTNIDPGGSLTKAVGQTLMYEELGFARSVGLVFELSRKDSDNFHNSETIMINPRVQVKVFSQKQK
jgi:hypothetical protein